MKLKKTSVCMAVVAILAAGVLLPQSASTALANSAQRYFRGVDAFGAAKKRATNKNLVRKSDEVLNYG